MVEILDLAKPSLLMTVPSVLDDIAFLEYYGVDIKTSRALQFVAFVTFRQKYIAARTSRCPVWCF